MSVAKMTTSMCPSSLKHLKRHPMSSVLTIVVATSLFPASLAADDLGVDSQYAEYYSYIMEQNETCYSDFANVSFEGVYCEANFEGFCWPPTQVGETVTFECESELHSVSRTCEENGKWEHKTMDDMYYECHKFTLLNLQLTLPCGIISFVACTIAFIILAFSRSLWCTRNYIHWHLITSFGLKYFVLCIPTFMFLVLDVQTSRAAGLAVFYISTYLEMTNFSWMFVEGLYLHTIVALAFRFDVDQIKFYWYCAIGWVVPLFFAGTFLIVCISTQFEDKVKDVALQIFVVLPITTVLVLNSIFLLNIVRILMSKLRESSGDTQLKHYRRTARATLVLVILLGISYVFPIFVLNLISGLPDMAVIVIMIINTIVGGLQGFLVSLIYVFMNSEVKSVITRKWEREFGFNPCPRSRNDYYAANTTISRMDDTPTITTVQSPRYNMDTESPNMNNNQKHSTGSQTLGNGKLSTNSNLENSYEMSVTSGDTSTSPVNGAVKEESSPLLAGNVIINENGRTVVHDHEDNTKEHNKKGTDV
ncbi:corticotropin-releasing factor receptor 2-like isoform X3 [Apostichopus japonicus]|uniref:corticotropin-releasing factor receptor 2-like isoform X3 n=2 Tax=Stichopus japonicus TaxID=307972 RepID=UPI003AB6A0B2